MERTPTDSQYVSNGLIRNPSSSNSESSTVVQLPQDLITEILVRLPVKPLMKFKCVSKPWLYLISSPQFIKSHFSTYSREGQYSNHQLLFRTLAPNSGIKHFSPSSALHNPSSTSVSYIEFPSQNPEMSLRIVGIVNGLVCLAIGVKKLYVWNPILKQSKLLPGSRSSLSGGNFVVHGFGYDESNDDYRVVKVSCVEHVHHGGNFETKVKVYSLRTDSWRRIEGFKDGFPFCNGTYANGNIFWATNRIFGSTEKWKIVSLDMVSGKYEEMQGPGYEAGASSFGMGSFRGCLSMICGYYKTKTDLWLRDNDGVEESWSKMLSIPCDDVHPSRSIRQVLCILGNGDIVLGDKSGLVVYNSKSKEFRDFPLDDCNSYSQTFLYVESMISPTNGS